MYTAREYVLPKTLEEAYQLNQKKQNRIIAGNMWLRFSSGSFGQLIDLSDLGLNTIRQTETEFIIGAMVPLRELEKHPELNAYTGNAIRDCVQDIVGTQFRNSATIGGSIWGRFGFSDILTCFLAMDTEVELFPSGRMTLADFTAKKPDNDILVNIILKKTGLKTAYRAFRYTATGLPVISCCVSKGDFWRIAIGARPAKAMLHILPDTAVLSSAEDTALKELLDKTIFGTNSTASADYRRHLAQVMIIRAAASLEV